MTEFDCPDAMAKGGQYGGDEPLPSTLTQQMDQKSNSNRAKRRRFNYNNNNSSSNNYYYSNNSSYNNSNNKRRLSTQSNESTHSALSSSLGPLSDDSRLPISGRPCSRRNAAYPQSNMWPSVACWSLAVLLVVTLPIDCEAMQITTEPQRFDVMIGERVELPCAIDGLDSDDNVVVLWKRGADLIAIDEDVQVDDNRLQIRKDDTGYALIISPLEQYDAADYTCAVTSTPQSSVVHKLHINVPPSAKLTPSTTPLLARLGEEVIVRCTGAGNPPPLLTWSRQPSGDSVPSVDGRLVFAAIAPADAGVYECRASNGVGGADAVAIIEIRVESSGGAADSAVAPTATDLSGEGGVPTAPWVETDQLYLPVEVGSTVNLSCRYNGEPEPAVDWLFSGFKINKLDSKFKSSDQFAKRYHNYTSTAFALRNVQEDHFGDYTCKISNPLGTAQRTIHVSGRPGPPALLLRAAANELSWTVQSARPVLEYDIHYRLSTDDTWTGHKVLKADKADQEGDFWTHKASLDFLQPDTQYELQVNAKNALGWGALARNFVTYEASSATGRISSNAIQKSTDVNGATRSSIGTSIGHILTATALVFVPLIVAL